MPLDVKICGLRSRDAITEVVRGGARFAGFVFYPPSPRNVSIGEAAELTSRLPGNTIRVGLFVDPTDDQIRSVRRHVFLDWIQLHGDETPDRVAAIKKLTGLPAMKAIKIAAPQDLEAARSMNRSPTGYCSTPRSRPTRRARSQAAMPKASTGEF